MGRASRRADESVGDAGGLRAGAGAPRARSWIRRSAAWECNRAGGWLVGWLVDWLVGGWLVE